MKTLQKIFVLLAVVLVLPGTSHAASDGLVRLSETGDYEPIQAEIPDLVPALNGLLQEEGLPAIDEADIDLSKAYPFYPADGFFASEITTAEAFEAHIRAQKDFAWYVPVEVPGRLMIVGMAREENGEWGCAPWNSAMRETAWRTRCIRLGSRPTGPIWSAHCRARVR